jgi:hypothetical protein
MAGGDQLGMTIGMVSGLTPRAPCPTSRHLLLAGPRRPARRPHTTARRAGLAAAALAEARRGPMAGSETGPAARSTGVEV